MVAYLLGMHFVKNISQIVLRKKRFQNPLHQNVENSPIENGMLEQMKNPN